jgi:hypothetical protein
MAVLPQYADAVTQQLMELSSHVGWGGDTQKVQQLVRQLMERAESIRTNIRGGIISVDLQPYIADCGTGYDKMNMKDASTNFGMAVNYPERCVVLGTIGLGLRAHMDRSGDDQSSELRGSKSRPRVILVEVSDPRADSRRAYRIRSPNDGSYT